MQHYLWHVRLMFTWCSFNKARRWLEVKWYSYIKLVEQNL